jgi:hypothetical protein
MPGPEPRLVFASDPAMATSAVLFIHGLSGDLRATWGGGPTGGFMARLAGDLPQTAVVAYDYPSELSRFILDETLTVRQVASHLAATLRSLTATYAVVGVVGYCLGGVLAGVALRELAQERSLQTGVVVFLLDVAHEWLVTRPDVTRALGVDSATLQENARFWREQTDEPGSHTVYALLSGKERWVAGIRPDAGLPAGRVATFDLAHESLPMAPVAGPFGPYTFVLERLRAMLDARLAPH